MRVPLGGVWGEGIELTRLGQIIVVFMMRKWLEVQD